MKVRKMEKPPKMYFSRLFTVTSAILLLPFVSGTSGDDVQTVMSKSCVVQDSEKSKIYDFMLSDIEGDKKVHMSRFKDFAHQYHGLNALQEAYKDLVVIGVPCNQFNLEEPGCSASEILNGIKFVRPGNGFVPNFLLTKKSVVNGKNEEPLYTYLKRNCPATRDGFADPKKLHWSPLKVNDVRWNWEKFLISKRGIPYMRYDACAEPVYIASDIENLLHDELQKPHGEDMIEFDI